MLHYTIYAHEQEKPWVTFIHGAGGSSTIWYRQIKAFKEEFNVLLIDLRGHGNSPILAESLQKKYTFPFIALDIIEVLDHLKIAKSHFIGISLGSILIRQIAEQYPDRVDRVVLGGAILKMNFRSQLLMKFGNIFKYVMPYIWLYKLFAFIIMPRANHKESRNLFVREARKLCQREFIKWFKLTSQINPLLRWFRNDEINIPTLYIMGEEDYMFLPSVTRVVKRHFRSSQLLVLKSCGHVVNVEQPQIFNENAINFLRGNAL